MGKALERADCGQVSVDVLSERDESKNGCVYSILLRQRDSSGTTSRAVFQVTVLPNQKLWRFGTLQLSRSSATVREVSWCPNWLPCCWHSTASTVQSRRGPLLQSHGRNKLMQIHVDPLSPEAHTLKL